MSSTLPLDYKPQTGAHVRRRWVLPLCSFGSLLLMVLSNRVIFGIYGFRILAAAGYIDWIRKGWVTAHEIYTYLSIASYVLLAIGSISALACWYASRRRNARWRGLLVGAIITLLVMYWVAPYIYAIYFFWGFSPH